MRSRWGRAGRARRRDARRRTRRAAGDAGRGARAYAARCASCHGPTGTGGAHGGSIVDGSYLALVSDQALRTTVVVGRPGARHARLARRAHRDADERAGDRRRRRVARRASGRRSRGSPTRPGSAPMAEPTPSPVPPVSRRGFLLGARPGAERRRGGARSRCRSSATSSARCDGSPSRRGSRSAPLTAVPRAPDAARDLPEPVRRGLGRRDRERPVLGAPPRAATTFQVFAINCAHLGCPVRWFPESRLFMCPCHGGVYYEDGSRASGPPPRGLYRVRATRSRTASSGCAAASCPTLSEPV